MPSAGVFVVVEESACTAYVLFFHIGRHPVFSGSSLAVWQRTQVLCFLVFRFVATFVVFLGWRRSGCYRSIPRPVVPLQSRVIEAPVEKLRVGVEEFRRLLYLEICKSRLSCDLFVEVKSVEATQVALRKYEVDMDELANTYPSVGSLLHDEGYCVPCVSRRFSTVLVSVLSVTSLKRSSLSRDVEASLFVGNLHSCSTPGEKKGL